MPKRKISDDIAEEAASLKRKGQSFRAIGAALGIDPRTAKGLADRVSAGNNKAHWQNVDTQLDVQYLGEHIHMLHQVGAGVLRAVQFHPNTTAPNLESDSWLAHQVGAALAQGGQGLLIGRGIATVPVLDRDIDVPDRVSRSLLDGLKEHEANVAVALDGRDGWTKRWRHFQLFRRKLIEQAHRRFLQRGCEEGFASSMAETAVKGLIQQCDETIRSNWIVDGPPVPDSPEAADYHGVVGQISLPEFRRRLKASTERVEEAADQVAKAVVEFQLRGKPDGRCFLCPSRSGP